jgi:hypothetical protein
VREAHADLPELFVVGIDDLLRLVDLARLGHSFPQALISWQTGGSRLPFDHHLHRLERFTGPARSRLTSTMERLIRPVIGDRPAAA